MLVDENKQLLDNLLKTNLLPLAFIGDAVHTICAREFCLEKFNDKMNNYHLKASFYCKASSQAKTLNKIYTLLNDEEKEIVRRGRNAKPKHQAKNATTEDYSFATAFEVLIGYLYLNGNQQRFNEIIKLSFN